MVARILRCYVALGLRVGATIAVPGGRLRGRGGTMARDVYERLDEALREGRLDDITRKILDDYLEATRREIDDLRRMVEERLPAPEPRRRLVVVEDGGS